MKVTSANGLEGLLLWCHAERQFFLRVYNNEDKSEFQDMIISHLDMRIKIQDEDAFVIERDDGEIFIGDSLDAGITE